MLTNSEVIVEAKARSGDTDPKLSIVIPTHNLRKVAM